MRIFLVNDIYSGLSEPYLEQERSFVIYDEENDEIWEDHQLTHPVNIVDLENAEDYYQELFKRC